MFFPSVQSSLFDCNFLRDLFGHIDELPRQVSGWGLAEDTEHHK